MMHLYSKILTVALLNTFLTGQLLGQATRVKGFFEKRKNLKKERNEAELPFLSPMIGPRYTPDAGVVFAIGGLLSFKTDRNDTLIQRSSLPVTFLTSCRGNISFGAKLKSFWWEDRGL